MFWLKLQAKFYGFDCSRGLLYPIPHNSFLTPGQQGTILRSTVHFPPFLPSSQRTLTMQAKVGFLSVLSFLMTVTKYLATAAGKERVSSAHSPSW